MISRAMAKRYTDRVEEIPCYAEAMADTEKVWDVHHFAETCTGWSKQKCIELGCYFNLDPKVLIFMPHANHIKIHSNNPRFRGHKHTEEELKKIGEASKRGWTPERKAKHAARMRELFYQGKIFKKV